MAKSSFYICSVSVFTLPRRLYHFKDQGYYEDAGASLIRIIKGTCSWIK